MEVLKFIISWSHTLSASLSLIIGAMVLLKTKGDLTHKKLGIYYFYMMLINNITALFIYNAFGKFFFPHWLAIITLALIIPGYLITKYKGFKYWLSIHIICIVLSYYMLIGGAINEAFLRIPPLKPLMISQSPIFGITHMFAQLFFIGALIYFIVKYRKKKFEAVLN